MHVEPGDVINTDTEATRNDQVFVVTDTYQLVSLSDGTSTIRASTDTGVLNERWVDYYNAIKVGNVYDMV